MGVEGERSVKEVRVAIVGAGYMATEHAKVFSAIEGVSVCGIFSRTRVKAETLAEEFDIALVVDSVEELFQKCEADLLVIAVPETAVGEVSRKAFDFPWTVLIEKPAGIDLREAEALRNEANTKGRQAFVALNRRFYSSTLSVGEDLDKIEGPRFIRVQDQQSLVDARSYGHPDEIVANWMYANSIHLVDYISCFARGNVIRTEVLQPWKEGESHVVLGRVEFDSGDVGIYEGLWERPGPWAVSVSTTDARFDLRPLEAAEFQLKGERKRTAYPLNKADEEFKPGIYLQAVEAVKAVRGESSRSVTLECGVKTMMLLSEIYGVS